MPARLRPNPWLSCPRPHPSASLRLWCLPFAGGGAAIWHPWAQRLASDIEVVGVRLPGRESRLAEPPLRDPIELVRAVAEALLPCADSPYALLGHSLGGLLAFGAMQELLARGAPMPAALIVSGIRAPHLPRTEPDLHALDDELLVRELDRRYGGIPPALREDRALLQLFLPALRADLHVYETFPLARVAALPVPILALGGESDPVVSREEILAWRAHTSAAFAARFFAGGHFFLQSELAAVTDCVREFLRPLLEPAARSLPAAACR